MNTRGDTPAGTGASDHPSGVGDAEGQDRATEAPTRGPHVDDSWATAEGVNEPPHLASGVQWGTYMRRWSQDTGERLTDAVLIATALSKSLSLREAVVALGHYTTTATLPPIEVPVVTAEDCPHPKPLWYINGNTLRGFVKMIPCGAWGCPVCGPARARRRARTIEAVFERFHGAWWGEVPGDSGSATMRQRRSRALRAGTEVGGWRITLASGDGVEVSNTALVGTAPPTTGRWLAPRAAAYEFVALHERQPESIRRVDRNGDLVDEVEEVIEVEPEAPPSAIIFLAVGNQRLREEVTRHVHEEAVRVHDVDPGDDNFRYSVPRQWLLDTFKQFADEATEARRGTVGW